MRNTGKTNMPGRFPGTPLFPRGLSLSTYRLSIEWLLVRLAVRRSEKGAPPSGHGKRRERAR